jgi:hypothetical protein
LVPAAAARRTSQNSPKVAFFRPAGWHRLAPRIPSPFTSTTQEGNLTMRKLLLVFVFVLAALVNGGCYWYPKDIDGDGVTEHCTLIDYAQYGLG